MSLLKEVFEISAKNAYFLKGNEQAEKSLREVVDLVNDIIDHMHALLKTLGDRFSRGESAFAATMIHMVMPLSYGILYNLMIGNLPACYFHMRIILEGLTKSIIADIRFPEYSFFEYKLECLENLLSETRLSFSKMCNLLLPKIINRENTTTIIELWKDLSEKWAHAGGIVKKVVEKIVREESPPPWSIIIPVEYDDRDLSDLQELASYVKSIRRIIHILVETWRSAYRNHET